MKYKWAVEILLINGQTVRGIANTDTTDGNEVVKMLFTGECNACSVINTFDEKGILLFKLGEIAVAKVYPLSKVEEEWKQK